MRLLLQMPVVSKKVKERIYSEVYNAFGGRAYEIIVGGAALSKEVEEFLLSINFPITVGYGTTECAPLISYCDWKEFVGGSCGIPVDRMDVKILSNDPENIPGDEQLLDNSGGLNEAPVIKSEPFAMDDITEELTVFFRECINTGRELSARCYHEEHRLEYLLSHWLFAVAAFYEDMPPENRRYFKCSFNGHGQYHQFVKEQPFNVGNTVLEDVLIQTTGI